MYDSLVACRRTTANFDCVKEVVLSKKMTDLSAPLSVATAPQIVITGSTDGLIEVRSSTTLKIYDTSYQAKEEVRGWTMRLRPPKNANATSHFVARGYTSLHST